MAEEKKKLIKDSEKRSLEKVEGGKFLLTISNTETEYFMQQRFTKAKLKEVYDELKPQHAAIQKKRGELRKAFKEADIEETPELTKLKEQIKSLQKLAQKDQLKQDLEAVERDYIRTEKELKEIEFAIPELKR